MNSQVEKNVHTYGVKSRETRRGNAEIIAACFVTQKHTESTTQYHEPKPSSKHTEA